tara:strand:- start:7502 stop:7834 length:333 start_codon:yes stop_codon:yes gene_type:complete
MTILDSKIVKARKEHNCSFCHSKINKGENYWNDTIVNDGGLYTWKAHTKCHDISHKLKMYDDAIDGVDSDMFVECIHEEFNSINQELKKFTFEEMLNLVCIHHAGFYKED